MRYSGEPYLDSSRRIREADMDAQPESHPAPHTNPAACGETRNGRPAVGMIATALIVVLWLALATILICSAGQGPPNYAEVGTAGPPCVDPVESVPKAPATLTAAGPGLQNIAFGFGLGQQRRRVE